MCDRILSEDLLTPAEACDQPGIYRIRRGVRQSASISAFYRLCTSGLLAVTGERIKLESIATASGRMTSKQAIRRFIAALNGLAEGEMEPAEIVQGGGGNAEAEAVLNRFGI